MGCCTAEERSALLQLLQHQGLGLQAAAAGAGDAPAVPPAIAAAAAQLSHSCLAYCSQQLTTQQWALLLCVLRGAFAQCTAALAAAAARVAGAVCAAASEIAVGADMQSPAVALQFFRRLKLKGVLERSDKVGSRLQQQPQEQPVLCCLLQASPSWRADSCGQGAIWAAEGSHSPSADAVVRRPGGRLPG